MSFENMVKTYSLADRLAYYSSDIEAIAESLDTTRITVSEKEERQIDAELRILFLSLQSLVSSLDKEVDLLLKNGERRLNNDKC
jgi:hypothetical protein